jgi:hypothetical protein
MLLLIEFAAQEGLPVALKDNDGNVYRSRTEYTSYAIGGVAGGVMGVLGIGYAARNTVSWKNADEFYQAVKQRIGAEALYGPNTVVNYGPPAPGDLMLRKTHCALVYRVYPPGERHPLAGDTKIPSFPGAATAKQQSHVTEYFKGTVGSDGVTLSRDPDQDYHYDYLNSRADAKRNAELIYFANAAQIHSDNFVFCKYAAAVLES